MSLPFKVYVGPLKKAETVHAEDAAAVAGLYDSRVRGEVQIRFGRRVVWTSKDGDAAESYDAVAYLCHKRIDEQAGL